MRRKLFGGLGRGLCTKDAPPALPPRTPNRPPPQTLFHDQASTKSPQRLKVRPRRLRARLTGTPVEAQEETNPESTRFRVNESTPVWSLLCLLLVCFFRIVESFVWRCCLSTPVHFVLSTSCFYHDAFLSDVVIAPHRESEAIRRTPVRRTQTPFKLGKLNLKQATDTQNTYTHEHLDANSPGNALSSQ